MYQLHLFLFNMSINRKKNIHISFIWPLFHADQPELTLLIFCCRPSEAQTQYDKEAEGVFTPCATSCLLVLCIHLQNPIYFWNRWDFLFHSRGLKIHTGATRKGREMKVKICREGYRGIMNCSEWMMESAYLLGRCDPRIAPAVVKMPFSPFYTAAVTDRLIYMDLIIDEDKVNGAIWKHRRIHTCRSRYVCTGHETHEYKVTNTPGESSVFVTGSI